MRGPHCCVCMLVASSDLKGERGNFGIVVGGKQLSVVCKARWVKVELLFVCRDLSCILASLLGLFIFLLNTARLFLKLYSTFISGVFTLLIVLTQFMFQDFVIVSVFVLVFFFWFIVRSVQKVYNCTTVFLSWIKNWSSCHEWWLLTYDVPRSRHECSSSGSRGSSTTSGKPFFCFILSEKY